MDIKVESKRTNKKDIIVLIPPWKAPDYFFTLTKKLIPNDFGYVCYHYSKNILTSDPFEVKSNIIELSDIVLSKLIKLNSKKTKNFYIYSISLGNSVPILLLDKINIKKAVLVVPGCDLADGFWNGDDTHNLKVLMEKKGFDLKKLRKIWKEINASLYFKDKSKKTTYLIKLAKKDKIIPYKNSLNLIKLLKKREINFKLQENQSLSHVLTCALESVYPISSLEFLIGRNTDFTNKIKKYIKLKNDVLEKVNSNIIKTEISKTKKEV